MGLLLKAQVLNSQGLMCNLHHCSWGVSSFVKAFSKMYFSFVIVAVIQARILEWVAIPFSRASSQSRDWTWVSHNPGRIFTVWASREAPVIHYPLQGLMVHFSNLTHLKRPWCWERLKAGGERDDRGSGGWMASPTRWTWVWVNSGSWWSSGRPGVLQSMGSQRIRYDWANELNWTELL